MEKITKKDLTQLAINTIRMLAIDIIEKAKSGHPGMPLGAATMAYILWTHFLKHNPKNPYWPNRDRFVLSAGHGSALLYSLLYLTGYDLSLKELKNFRQWKSKTPGHPEYNVTPGVEATTGPLGEGLGIAVGMAIAERYLASQFNRPGLNIVNHHTYAMVSDGDLMEGVAYEAASLAGTIGLEKLICLYDNNKITIEGSTSLSFKEDVGARFKTHNWRVIGPIDGNNPQAIFYALEKANIKNNKPTLIICLTNIGYGSPKQDSALAHGEPLGTEAIQATRIYFSWLNKSFYIPTKALKHLHKTIKNGQKQENSWQKAMTIYTKSYPILARTFANQTISNLPKLWEKFLPIFNVPYKKMATREASGKILNSLTLSLTNIVGGSADLAPSTKTLIFGSNDLRNTGKKCGRNIHFGVREHAMGAATNGIALHSGIIPYSATFLVFSDFMRPTLRLAALMQTHSIFIFTHDSLAVGEDGPTHQPIEHLMSFRLIPGFTIIRPADPNETSAAWAVALTRKGPTALILTRQKVPILDPTKYPINEGVAKGAYILSDYNSQPQLILIATGSEVFLALEAQNKLNKLGIKVQVVSMPSWELFHEQNQAYRNKVLPPKIKARLAIEAGTTIGWEHLVGQNGIIVGYNHFGISAPGDLIMEKLGFNVKNIVKKSLKLINK